MISLILLTLHFIGDFLFQTDWMAINKSKRWDALSLHVLVYSLVFSYYGIAFVALVAATHFLTDAVTSRITSRLWQANQRHWFFVVIGADQLLHYATLVGIVNVLR